MSLATTAPQQPVRLPDGGILAGQSEHGRRNNGNHNNQNRRRWPSQANGGEQAGDVMPGTGAYLLQQQQQQQQVRGNRARRGNQTLGDGSASVPPPSQVQAHQQQPNGQAGPSTDGQQGQGQGQGKRRNRPPRHRNRPAQGQTNGDTQPGSQPLSRVPTNGSTAGSTASASNTPTNRRGGQARSRGFNSQLTETANRGDRLDPSAGPFVPGDRAQRGRNNGNQARRPQTHSRSQSQGNLDQPPHLASASSTSTNVQYQIQDQQNQARSRIQPQPNNRRNARARKPFQGNLSGATMDFEEMQERAVIGGAIPATERKYRGWGGMKDEEDGLVSKLVRGLGGVGGNWLECVICFSTILPQQPIWSCSPTTSAVVPGEITTNACCFTPFHLSCIQDWSSRSLAEAKEKARDRDTRIYPEEPVLTWRCPGCQKKRIKEANKYECYCGKVKNMSTGHGAVGKDTTGDGASLVLPHSCGNSCSRDRSYCGHPCPLQCHPGPCPPCQVPLVIPCPSHKKDLVVKCSLAKGKDVPVPACEEPCERLLACQAHACDKLCHDGDCARCTAKETVRCYCGVDEREVDCGWRKREEQTCGDGKDTWEGRFGCERVCARPYDCGNHTCQEECHPHPLKTLKCPRSPDLVTHCPCGRTPLGELTSTSRMSCTEKIPTCALRCNRPRSDCDHPCDKLCHEGECTPCREMVVLPCRCGSSKVEMICSERQEMEKQGQEVLCERVCKALRSCGRHECARFCCPLSYQAKFKGKKRDIAALGDDEAGLHTCSLPCNKVLTCGVHHCPKPDHRGPCPPCLEASYEELGCNCGRTVIHPPIRCGTVIDCTYPCARPAPECGHPKVPHTCHETEACPPCPYLTTKKCACGKNEVKNVRCSQEKVTCGVICNSLLSCGYHHCMKPCHSAGDCEEPCQQVCQKPKRLCKHPCPITCHAPSACPEDEPCSATVDQTCPCGHVKQRTACGACTGNPVSRESVQLKCVSECAQRQRNARLAEALGIKPSEKLVEYPAELRTFATANHAFVLTVEKAFNDFFMGPKQATLLPHTPAHKRQFILGLAEVYRFGTELVDADPHRSVQLRRRIDSRIPNPLLSAATGAPPAAKRQLGGLGDMKKASFASLAGPSSVIAPNPVRGWGSASLSRPSSPQVHPSRMSGTPSLARPSSRPEPPVSTGSGIHKLDHITGSYTPPQKRDIEENAKDWDEED